MRDRVRPIKRDQSWTIFNWMWFAKRTTMVQSVIYAPDNSAKAWNSARAVEKARALTWINALRLPPAQTIPVPSAIRQAIAGERKEETAMENAKLSRSPNLTKTIIIGGSAALAAAVLFAGLAVAPRSASALPAYSQKEGKACGYCHTNPAGGGPRNARGQQYEAGGHSFKKK
jgi:hypothetical protein